MKLLKVSLPALLSVLAQNENFSANEKAMIQRAEDSCCFDPESIDCKDALNALSEEELPPPRCPAFDKSTGGSCPNFCNAKPDDFSCSPYFIRGTRNSHFLPFGTENGDSEVSKSGGLGSNSGPVAFDMNFSGVKYKFAYVLAHGSIQLKKRKKSTWAYFNYYKTLEKESKFSQNPVKFQPKCRQKSVNIQPKISQNAAKNQS